MNDFKAPEKIYTTDHILRYHTGWHIFEVCKDGDDYIEYTRSDLVNQWRPIEEAPKDGTAILGWRKDWLHPLMIEWTCAAEFLSDEEIEKVDGPLEWELDCNWFGYSLRYGEILDPDYETPTHFMLLPEPPKEENS